ncbi:MAG: hypothetical protein IJ763_10325 [Lachnospiraceae bacterium]|nr:hypothetical protein [Lachnospiraceae bacterium]
MTNQERYKNIFDSIESSSEITLDSLNKRKHELKKKRLRNSLYAFAAFAVFFLGSNVVSYAKTGEFWVASVFNIKTGSGMEVTVDNSDPDVSMITINYDEENATNYYSVENGRLYFIFNDIKQDITDECSEDKYFKYEYTDEDSYRHAIIIGGTVDNPGWAEYIFDKDGNYVFNTMSVSTSGDDECIEFSLYNDAYDSSDVGEESYTYEDSYSYVESDGETEGISYIMDEETYSDDEEYCAITGTPKWLLDAEISLGVPTGNPKYDQQWLEEN